MPAKDFSRGYFTFWAVIAIVWGLVATVLMIVWPIAENITPIMRTMKNLFSGNRVTLAEFQDVTVRPEDMSKKGEPTAEVVDMVAIEPKPTV